MSTDTPDETVADEDAEGRCAELTIGDEEFVVYDTENHRAWIQSDLAVPVDERR